MKKAIFFVFLFLLMGLSPVLAQAHQNFTIVNMTGLSIDQLFISAANVEDWQEDVLGQDVLLTDESCNISFSPTEESCLWDIKIIDGEGDALEWNDIDLCKAYTVTIYWQDGKAWAEMDETAPTE